VPVFFCAGAAAASPLADRRGPRIPEAREESEEHRGVRGV